MDLPLIHNEDSKECEFIDLKAQTATITEKPSE